MSKLDISSIQLSPEWVMVPIATRGGAVGTIRTSWFFKLIAPSDLLHAAVISANRDRATVITVAALVSVPFPISSVRAGVANIDAYSVRTEVHTLSQCGCWSRGT
jgi:hypothetical protein